MAMDMNIQSCEAVACVGIMIILIIQHIFILPYSILENIQILSTITSSAMEAEESACIEAIKTHMDEHWEPNWQVVCGRSFGSLVTHQANRFLYMYVGDRAVMIYKA